MKYKQRERRKVPCDGIYNRRKWGVLGKERVAVKTVMTKERGTVECGGTGTTEERWESKEANKGR